MAYWLMKSEPNVFGWDTLKDKGIAAWDDVRNYQARNNMMAMKKGEQVFFYHSNIGKEIVGIAEVVKEHYPDPADPRFVLVDVKCKKKLKNPVTLTEIKPTRAFRISHLSVNPDLGYAYHERRVGYNL